MHAEEKSYKLEMSKNIYRLQYLTKVYKPLLYIPMA